MNNKQVKVKISSEEVEKIASEIHGKFAYVNLGYEDFTVSGTIVEEEHTCPLDCIVLPSTCPLKSVPSKEGECTCDRNHGVPIYSAGHFEDCPCNKKSNCCEKAKYGYHTNARHRPEDK